LKGEKANVSFRKNISLRSQRRAFSKKSKKKK
jgi:hypothetical protein